jgi:glucose-1-phosphate thymidylyltransferase
VKERRGKRIMSCGRNDLVGLVPAGGTGSRIDPLPLSKELYPLGFHSLPGRGPRTKVAAQYLLESMRMAGVDRTMVIVRKGKWDIPAFFGDGDAVGMRIAYLALDQTSGVPFTVDAAYPYVRSNRVAFGFPDIIHEPGSALRDLVERQDGSGADVVLGLFRVHRCEKMDMVDVAPDGRVRTLVIKPERTALRFTWILAVWSPRFTEHLHDYVADQRGRVGNGGPGPGGRELFMGDVLQSALDGGMSMQTVLFDNGSYLDIGTPEDLIEAVCRTAHTWKGEE